MGILDDYKKAASLQKVIELRAEELLYDHIRREIESGSIRSGLWTKATATANHTNQAAIEQKYIQLRFEQLKAEGELLQRFAAEIEEELRRRTTDEQPKPIPQLRYRKPNQTQHAPNAGTCKYCGPWWKSGQCHFCGTDYGPKR